MNTYPLTDIFGNVIGKITLENEDLPKAIINNAEFFLAVSHNPVDKKVLSFIVVPAKFEEEVYVERN